MKMSVKELKGHFIMMNDMKGFTQGFLESHLHHLSEKEDWETFMGILALTLYGVMLFRKVECFVDCVSIDAFIAFKGLIRKPCHDGLG